MGIEGFSPEVKQPGHETDHSPPYNADVKNGGAPPYVVIAQGQLYFFTLYLIYSTPKVVVNVLDQYLCECHVIKEI
jgi:hypothetical protein